MNKRPFGAFPKQSTGETRHVSFGFRLATRPRLPSEEAIAFHRSSQPGLALQYICAGKTGICQPADGFIHNNGGMIEKPRLPSLR